MLAWVVEGNSSIILVIITKFCLNVKRNSISCEKGKDQPHYKFLMFCWNLFWLHFKDITLNHCRRGMFHFFSASRQKIWRNNQIKKIMKHFIDIPFRDLYVGNYFMYFRFVKKLTPLILFKVSVHFSYLCLHLSLDHAAITTLLNQEIKTLTFSFTATVISSAVTRLTLFLNN